MLEQLRSSPPSPGQGAGLFFPQIVSFFFQIISRDFEL